MHTLHSLRSLTRFRRVAILTLSLALVLLCLPAARMTEAGSRIGRLPKDSVAQRQLKMTDGSQQSLLALRGKVVVLSFFAVWCGHSRDQVPALVRLSETEGSRGLQVIGLAVEDERTTAEKVSSFISAHKINYPVGTVTDPVFAEFISSRAVDVPQTLVYGRDGRLAAHFVGQNARIDAALDEVVRKELDKK
ncbi:MAG TPA: TlpA disulfide reductase family protein [Blastocatellia bacterium]|nr:TlpA disulfide reductase family protein [Blastocatellia bacterium]